MAPWSSWASASARSAVADGVQVGIGDGEPLDPVAVTGEHAWDVDGGAEEVLGGRAGAVGCGVGLQFSGDAGRLRPSCSRRSGPGTNAGRWLRMSALARLIRSEKKARWVSRSAILATASLSAALKRGLRLGRRDAVASLLALEQRVGGGDRRRRSMRRALQRRRGGKCRRGLRLAARRRCGSVRPGASCGSARSSARSAARMPALSPSRQSTGAPPDRQSSCNCSSVSAVPHGATAAMPARSKAITSR